jgi:hypothetical protein
VLQRNALYKPCTGHKHGWSFAQFVSENEAGKMFLTAMNVLYNHYIIQISIYTLVLFQTLFTDATKLVRNLEQTIIKVRARGVSMNAK